MHLDNLTPADLDALITTPDAAKLLNPGNPTKTANRIRDWKRRGIIKPTGLDQHGRPMYRIIDILQTEQKMRTRR